MITQYLYTTILKVIIFKKKLRDCILKSYKSFLQIQECRKKLSLQFVKKICAKLEYSMQIKNAKNGNV
jgi:hypothetical protein